MTDTASSIELGFIGFGNMAQAMAQGLVDSGALAGEHIHACAGRFDKLQATAEKLGANAYREAAEVVEASDFVVLAVKPYLIEQVVEPVRDLLADKAVISVAAGRDFAFYEGVLAPNSRHLSTIPNTPIAVGAGVIACEQRHSLTDEELASKPVGSGPWCYETINAADGGRISFTANHRYTGPWPATCERMEWSVLLDDTRRTDELIDKDVMVMVMEAAPVVRAEELADAGATVEWVPGFNLPFLMFNCEKPPFDDVRVRQALLYAIDVDSLIGTYMAGHARAATSLLPDYFRHYHRAATVYSYDPEKARKLLAEAGVDELALALRANDNWVSTLAPAIAEDWKAVGVTAEVVLLDTTALFADLSTEPEPGTLLPFDVVLSPGDPSCFGNDADLIISWWYGDNVWTQGRSCWKKAGDGKFDELQTLMQQAREATGNEQQELWNKCFDLLAEEVPLYPLFHRELATGYQETQITGFEPIATTGLVFLGASVKA